MNDTLDDPTGPAPTEPLPPPQPPPAATAPIIGGVCATLADRLGIDALWIRIGFVFLAVSSGVGLFAYLGLWLALVVGQERRSRALVALGTVIIMLTLLGAVPLTLTIPSILGGTVFSPLGLPIVALLAGVAIALWQPRSSSAGATFGRRSQAADAPVDDTATGPGRASPGSVPPATPAPTPPRPPRPPSALGPLTLGAAFLVVALGALVDQLNGGRLHPEQWLGAGALVCGLGLLVGAVRGHARWLVLPAFALGSLGFLAGHMAGLGIEPADLVGERHVYPNPIPGAPQVSERVGLGRLVVHADEIPFPDDDGPATVVDVRVGIGVVDVWVPDGLRVHIETRTSTRIRGLAVRRVGDHVEVGPDGPPQLVVRASVGMGQVRVHHTWSAPPDIAPDAPVPPVEGLVDLGSLIGVTDGVAMTADGVFVLGDADAVIDADDELLVGDWWEESPSVTVISTNWGEFRLLPRSLLTTPYGEVLDLQALRASHATTSTSTPTPDPTPTTAEVTTPDTPETEG